MVVSASKSGRNLSHVTPGVGCGSARARCPSGNRYQDLLGRLGRWHFRVSTAIGRISWKSDAFLLSSCLTTSQRFTKCLLVGRDRHLSPFHSLESTVGYNWHSSRNVLAGQVVLLGSTWVNTPMTEALYNFEILEVMEAASIRCPRCRWYSCSQELMKCIIVNLENTWNSWKIIGVVWLFGWYSCQVFHCNGCLIISHALCDEGDAVGVFHGVSTSPAPNSAQGGSHGFASETQHF